MYCWKEIRQHTTSDERNFTLQAEEVVEAYQIRHASVQVRLDCLLFFTTRKAEFETGDIWTALDPPHGQGWMEMNCVHSIGALVWERGGNLYPAASICCLGKGPEPLKGAWAEFGGYSSGYKAGSTIGALNVHEFYNCPKTPWLSVDGRRLGTVNRRTNLTVSFRGADQAYNDLQVAIP